MSTMTEFMPKAPHAIEREKFQSHLAIIDRDAPRLQSFIAELYNNARENPHMLYAAATHLTALSHLDRRDASERIILPEQQEAAQAFAAYTQLLSMLAIERNSPLYASHERIYVELAGTREEIAFHAVLSYASAHGADFVALPTPAIIDFTGYSEASDVQIFFAGASEADLEIQVKTQPAGYSYHPRIAILSLASALGSEDKAAELRGILKDIGGQTDGSPDTVDLPTREHDIILEGAAAIMKATYDWGSAEPAEL